MRDAHLPDWYFLFRGLADGLRERVVRLTALDELLTGWDFRFRGLDERSRVLDD